MKKPQTSRRFGAFLCQLVAELVANLTPFAETPVALEYLGGRSVLPTPRDKVYTLKDKLCRKADTPTVFDVPSTCMLVECETNYAQ